MRLPQNIKNDLGNRINNGQSINHISRELDLAKSTIYYYYTKIMGRKYTVLTLKPGFSRVEGEIVGIFTGDGSQYFEPKKYHYEVKVFFGNKNIQYGLYVKKLFDDYFGKQFNFTKNTPWAYAIKTCSKSIYYFFHYYLFFDPPVKHSTVSLKSIDVSKDFLCGFLKGLLDTDGCVHRTKYNTFAISYYTTSRELAYQLQKILSGFDIKSSVYSYKPKVSYWKIQYIVQVWKGNAERFLTLIDPYKFKKYQGL